MFQNLPCYLEENFIVMTFEMGSTVEWKFAPQKDNSTFVTITESGFIGNGDELVKQVTDSTQGFSLVLAGLKALLEHNVQLNLVADRYPKGIEEH
jgi:uncharacterized protein YndB with AHSA1/START domain